MEIRKTVRPQSATTRGRSLPVPIAPAASDAVPITSAALNRAGGPAPRRLHHRPEAAFLAQLASQYDDIEELRLARRALRTQALASYQAPRGASDPLGTAYSLSV